MHYRALAATVLLFAVGSAAQAGTVIVEAGTVDLAAPASVAQNSSFLVDLVLDASDLSIPGPHPGLYSGEVIVSFDLTQLTYNSFTLAGGVSYYLPPVVATNGNTRTVHLGFDNAPETGTVGTFSFTAIGSPGTLAAIGLADGDPIPGSFVNTVGTNQRFYPTFTGAEVSIVPAPAGVWLLGTAVGALAIRRRLRSAA
jgi:hypothetical protein